MSKRIGYPFELEWYEGDSFHFAWRVLHGQSWYPAPSVEFMPASYFPGYFVACAGAMRLFGESLAVMRGVSAIGTVAALAAIVAIVQRHTGRLTWGFVAAGLFISTYTACGAFFDVARVDMLALAGALGGVWLVDRGRGLRAFLCGIVLLSAACLVKQTYAAFLVVTIGLWLVWDWRRALAGIGLAAALLVPALLALQWSSDGWFTYYTWRLPGAMPRQWDKFESFWRDVLIHVVGWATPLALTALFALPRRRNLLPVWLLPAALAVSLTGWMNPGGFINNLIPAAAFLSIAAGLGLDIWARVRWRWPAAVWGGMALVVAQISTHRIDISSNCPAPEDEPIAWAVVDKVRALPAPVLAPYQPYLLHLAGHEMHMQFHMLNELLEANEHGAALPDNGLFERIAQQLRQHHWQAYISAEHRTAGEIAGTWIDQNARRYYRRIGSLFPLGGDRTLYPLTGNPVRPCAVYRPVSP